MYERGRAKKGGRGNGGKCSLREGEKEGGEEKEFKTETEGHTRVPNAQSQRKGTGLNKSILKGFFRQRGMEIQRSFSSCLSTFC